MDQILEELENLLLEAPRVPFTNKRMIEEDELARLLDELRDALPGAVMEANRLLGDRQRILDDAQQEAQRIVDQAKSYVSKLTDENIITRQAQEQATEILEQARKSSYELQSDANQYADNVFIHLENNLEKALEVIRQGHAGIKPTKGL